MSDKKEFPTVAEVGILMTLANFISGLFKAKPARQLKRAKADHAERRLAYDKMTWARISDKVLDLQVYDTLMGIWDRANPVPEMADFDPSVPRKETKTPNFAANIELYDNGRSGMKLPLGRDEPIDWNALRRDVKRTDISDSLDQLLDSNPGSPESCKYCNNGAEPCGCEAAPDDSIDAL